MTESTGSLVVVDAPSGDSSSHGRDWHAPTLATLGDAADLTKLGVPVLPDGTGTNGS